jgi:vacuolar protein sorting-associated protein 13A/C
LNISIPWNDLKNKPLKIEIDNVFILANPIISADYDFVEEDRKEQDKKQQRLREAEESLSKMNAEQSAGYFGQIWSTVVDNIQISIKNIHIRYEDSVSCPDSPFGIGLTLNELSAVSTDKDWKTNANNPPVNFGTIYKLLKLGHFGMYCTTSSTSFFKENADEIYHCFADTIAKSSQVDPARQFIMNPVSGVGKLTWVKVTDITRPIYELFLDFDDLAFNLDDKQYSTFMSIFGTLSRQHRSFPYRRFRPPKTISPKLDPKAWLVYAGKCILHDIHQKRYQWTWEYFKTRRDQRKRYISLYGKVRQGKFTENDIDELNALELDLSYDDIRFYRHLTLKGITPKSAESPKQEQPAKSGWYGWITGASQQAQDEDWNTKLQKLYESMDLDKDPVLDQVYPMDYVKIKVNSSLASGSLTLRNFLGDTVNDMAFMRFENLMADYFQYPESISTFFKMKHLVVSEPNTSNSVFSTLVEAKHEKDDSNFLELQFESNPLDKRADNALLMKMLPLKVTMNPVVLSDIFGFFQPKNDELDSLNRLQAAAQEAIEGVTSQTKAGLVFAIEEHKTLDLNIEVAAPIFMFPSRYILNDLVSRILMLRCLSLMRAI